MSIFHFICLRIPGNSLRQPCLLVNHHVRYSNVNFKLTLMQSTTSRRWLPDYSRALECPSPRVQWKLTLNNWTESDSKLRVSSNPPKPPSLAHPCAIQNPRRLQSLFEFKFEYSCVYSGVSSEEIKANLARVMQRGVNNSSCQSASAHHLGSCRMGSNPTTLVVNHRGEIWKVKGLFVADGSVFPTSFGVNPMVTIQSIAYCTTESVVHCLQKY